MAEKQYEWVDGAVLELHSHRKHKLLREYFFQYLAVRCQLPQQERFRLAVIDGFAGGGRYSCGSAGSPIIFLEELKKACVDVNLRRIAQGLGLIEIECLLILNDFSSDAVDVLKRNVAPLLLEIEADVPQLHIRVEYLNQRFEDAYPHIKNLIAAGRYRNMIFNLDQYGYSQVKRSTLIDITRSYQSVEVFYTFSITSLLAFLQKSDAEKLKRQLSPFGVDVDQLIELQGGISKSSWMGAAERLVFDTFKQCAAYVSPFSINNPGGWRYWFIHFANAYRARQVYNNVLHGNSDAQAHYGRPGLDMLSYDPSHAEGGLYLFDQNGREQAKEQLIVDIPRMISGSGDVIPVMEFYEGVYNATPAHAEDIHKAIIENPDIEVITTSGGERRVAHTIAPTDVLKLKKQRSFFQMFFEPGK